MLQELPLIAASARILNLSYHPVACFHMTDSLRCYLLNTDSEILKLNVIIKYVELKLVGVFSIRGSQLGIF